jgi:TolB protein
MKYMAVVLLFATWACSPISEKSHADLKIIYNVHYDTLNDNYEIFSMNLDGSDKRNISNTPGVDWVYYAYKDKVYFISDRDTTHRMYFLYVMDADGNNVRQVTDLRLEDSWHNTRNDGKEIIVSGRIGNEIRNQLYSVDTETGNYRPVAHDTAAMFSDPAFSPDGKQLVFRHRQNKRNFRNEKAELWIMPADGGVKKQLTFFPADSTADWFVYHAGPPMWHPTEDFISYQSLRNGKYALFGVKPTGGEPWKLIENNTTGLEEGWHSWSPDGQLLAVELSNFNELIVDVYLMDWKTKELKRLTDDNRFEQAPVFVEVKK